jgi:hypothetical protein
MKEDIKDLAPGDNFVFSGPLAAKNLGFPVAGAG